MKNKTPINIKLLILLFMTCLVISGLTVFPLSWEIEILLGYIDYFPVSVQEFILKIDKGLDVINSDYQFFRYGLDWLGFAHIVIAIAFIGPFMDVKRNIWVIWFGLIACFMLIPFAFIFMPLRGIPFIWTLVDCSFGIFGAILLFIILHKSKKLNLN